MSELALRVLFSVVAAPVALWIVLAGGAPLAALLAIVSAIGAWEFYRIVRGAGAHPLGDVGVALAGLLPLAVYASYLGAFVVRPALLALLVLLLLGATIWLRGVGGRPIASAATTLLGVVYTAGMLSFGYAIRYHDTVAGYDVVGARQAGIGAWTLRVPPGGVLLIFPLVVTWASDIGAYFVGRAIGGRKLIPSVSPGKTVAGAVGGLVTSMLVSWLYARTVLVPVASLGFTPWGALAFGGIVSVAAQTGDLFESLIKREGGVKDSSRIIPGHGGVLDRFDSLIFVLPVAYLLLGWLPIPILR
ncbi:MAG: phosphatidate cytidylyltransferase [Gemmatimonadaceae bacterium]|nr:phosphatidate cytidylyltransferase [Gemmatimonadaceae bacterium]NUP69624.1 phosphatidate cytidylyltransferase [Gemmatimonadaceae bacterium]NUS31457.1 phosphatidate cytidylyltransferase [Gemmatimonadaceae bacterium]NUS49132.1 phosphatidate cytidylyltransferase [Gemmatimonadaceae bacterium]